MVFERRIVVVQRLVGLGGAGSGDDKRTLSWELHSQQRTSLQPQQPRVQVARDSSGYFGFLPLAWTLRRTSRTAISFDDNCATLPVDYFGHPEARSLRRFDSRSCQ
ncbi:hypothetical protein HGRIS_001077 [Hohenbuehelia grisea]|uniref:Uncharacterized protein n=1 Tax=Hohenbuehelia grisea TaxID=104357 RepID=A0ABR3JPP5_9AGAR